MLAVLAAAVAYNPPGVDDAFLAGRIRAFEDAASCKVPCASDACKALENGTQLVDAVVLEHIPNDGVNDSETGWFLIKTTEAVFNGTDPNATKTVAQLFGKTPGCELALEHVALGSVRVNASSAAAGSTRARFELPVMLALADSFGAMDVDGDVFDISFMAARVVNASADPQPTLVPMPPVEGCDFENYVCSVGVCTVLDINYQNFFELNNAKLIQAISGSDISFHQKTVQNRLFGLTFCGPVFGRSIRSIEGKTTSAPRDNTFYPTDVKKTFQPDPNNPFAGLRVTHGHSIEVLYPAWSPIGCDRADADDIYCELQPSDAYGGLPFRQERTTNNMPLYTTYQANESRVICPNDQSDLSKGFDAIEYGEGFSVVLPLAVLCTMNPSDEFFFKCCKVVDVNYVITDTGTTYEGLFELAPTKHTVFSAPMEFENRSLAGPMANPAYFNLSAQPHAACPDATPAANKAADARACAEQCITVETENDIIDVLVDTDTGSCSCVGNSSSCTFDPSVTGSSTKLVMVVRATGYYDNKRTVIGWSDTLLPCCPWWPEIWQNVSSGPPEGAEYEGAETCVQNYTDIMEYAAQNPEWLANCRETAVKGHDTGDWVDIIRGSKFSEVGQFYDPGETTVKVPMGDGMSSTVMPIFKWKSDACTFDIDNVLTSKRAAGVATKYSGLYAASGECGEAEARRVLAFNAFQGGDDPNTPVVHKPADRLQFAVMITGTDDCMLQATAWYVCKQIEGSVGTHEPATVWAINPPTNKGLLGSAVQPCNGQTLPVAPVITPMYTGVQDHDRKMIGRKLDDPAGSVYMDIKKDYARQGSPTLAQAARLMYVLEPRQEDIAHLGEVSNCAPEFYAVNPFDADHVWLGNDWGGEANTGTHIRFGDEAYCPVATLSAPVDPWDREYTMKIITGSDISPKVAVGSVSTSTMPSHARDETMVSPRYPLGGSKPNPPSSVTTGDGEMSIDTLFKEHAYDTFATDSFRCDTAVRAGDGEKIVDKLNTFRNSDCTGDTSSGGPYLERFPLDVGEVTSLPVHNGVPKQYTLNDGTLSMAARFACRVTNDAGLMPEVIQYAPKTNYGGFSNSGFCSHTVTPEVCLEWVAGTKHMPTDRRGPYAVFDGTADQSAGISSRHRSSGGKMHTATGVTMFSLNTAGPDTFASERYKGKHHACNSVTPTSDRPVWYKGCVLHDDASRAPMMTQQTPSSKNPHIGGAYLIPQNASVVPPDSPTRSTKFSVTPSWYPRARMFTGDYDHDAVNPVGVSGPFRFVLDAVEFFGAAPTNVSAMLRTSKPGAIGLGAPARFLTAPMPVQAVGAGPRYVPADYPRRPYVPPAEDTCMCDRDVTWACITEGPEYWAKKGGYDECADAGNEPNKTTSIGPPTCSSMLRKCAWSWQVGGAAIQGGVAGDVGLFIYSTRGKLSVSERDPLDNPEDADEVLKKTFVEAMAPAQPMLKRLQAMEGRTYTLPGPCVRSPFGVLHSNAMTEALRSRVFYREGDGPYEVHDEALIGYCETFGTKYQQCGGDKRSLSDRAYFCASTPHVNDIVMGWTVAQRRTRCGVTADGTRVCLYYAGEPGVDTLQELVGSVAGATIVVVPLAWSVIRELEANMFLYDIRQPATGTLRDSLTAFQRSQADLSPSKLNAEGIAKIPRCFESGASPVPGAAVPGGPVPCRQQLTAKQMQLIEDPGAFLGEYGGIQDVKDAVAGIYDMVVNPKGIFNTRVRSAALGAGEDCADGLVFAPVSSSTPSDTAVAACVDPNVFRAVLVGRGHTLATPNTTLTTINGPIVMTATDNPNCNGIIVAAPGATIDAPLEIDQRLCPGTEATMMGVVIVGPDARDAFIANVTVEAPGGKQPATVAALGYDSLYGTKTVVDVTGLSAFVVDPPGFAFAFAHAVADAPPNLGVDSGPVTVLLQEAAAEHFNVSADWETTNVTKYTSVFGWGYESKLYHQATRAETVAAVGVAVAAAVGLVLAILLGASLCVIRAEENKI
jgi:hypothetical protein